MRTLGTTLLVLGLGLAVAPPTEAAGARPVLHRVVWDESLRGRPGVHLWAADHDGSGARKIYTSHHGFTTELTLDRRGRRVAFAPCCRPSLPTLVVVNVSSGRVQKPLARHPQFYVVGGIGWSPHGSRLVFEGYVRRHGRPTSALWTVRPDGSGLHELLPLDDPVTDESADNAALAWTRLGVMYCDRDGLRIARGGHSRALIPGVYSVRISGDGRHIVTERESRTSFRSSIWYGNADGTHQHRLWLSPRSTTSGAARYGEPVPDFHGRHLLTERETESDTLVDWPATRKPSAARSLAFITDAFGYAWN